MHIFGDMATYPPAAWRAYDPTPATLQVYNAEAARMGFSRVVFVQPVIASAKAARCCTFGL